jgi:hypothetical protein
MLICIILSNNNHKYKTNEIALFTLQKSFFFLLLLNSCSAPEVENETTSTNNTSPILTNKTFDLVLLDK